MEPKNAKMDVASTRKHKVRNKYISKKGAVPFTEKVK